MHDEKQEAIHDRIHRLIEPIVMMFNELEETPETRGVFESSVTTRLEKNNFPLYHAIWNNETDSNPLDRKIQFRIAHKFNSNEFYGFLATPEGLFKVE